MKLFVAIVTMLYSLNFVSCKDDDIDPADRPGLNILENLSSYQGIWHSVALDVLGHRIPMENDPEFQDLYMIADPENNNMGVLFPGDKDTDPEFYVVKQSISKDAIVLVDPDKYDDYKKDPESVYTLGVTYKALSEKEILATIQIRPLLGEEDIILKELGVYFEKDQEFENKLVAQTRGSGNWFTNMVHSVGRFFTGDPAPGSTLPEPWSNSNWKPENWMSNLSEDLPVACVNIPGSHDSSATEEKMGVIANYSDAWVQDYSIHDQFNKGARYFDLRVGCPLIRYNVGTRLRTLSQEEMDATTDLGMYHGPLPTETSFVGTLNDLSKLVKGSKEFVFINVQAESECTGIITEGDHKLGSFDGQMHTLVNNQSMIIANRLLREIDERDNLFVIYKPSLTVKEARGHIIVLMDNRDRRNPYGETDHITYYEKWPGNNSGYADLIYYENNTTKITQDSAMYVQSRYEMKTDDTEKIRQKKNDMMYLADIVTMSNKGKKYVLGFNATNANTGSTFLPLKTQAFAEMFNSYLYKHYHDNMSKRAAMDLRCGIVSMDHYGYNKYVSLSWDAFVCGDYLRWAVIESNFYERNPHF